MRLKSLYVVGLLLVGTATADASTLWRIDFTSGRANGFFEIDPTNFVVPVTAALPTTFSVVDAEISVTDPGWLFGPTIRYTLGDLLKTQCSPGECSLTFGTQVFIPNFGTYHPKLQMNFDKIWIDWIGVDQQRIFQSFTQEAFAHNWFEVGDAQRTIVAVPELPTWAMVILGFAGVGYLTYRRRNDTQPRGA